MSGEVAPGGASEIQRYAEMFPPERIIPLAPGAVWSVLGGDGVTLVYWSFQAPECGELPMHHHPQSQAGYVLDGEMVLKFGDGTRRVVKAGDFYSIASGVKHGAVVNDRVTIVDVYTPERPDYEERFRFSLRAKQDLDAQMRAVASQ